MTRDKQGALPSALRDHEEAVKAEGEKANAKIDEAFGKLAKKMRERAEKAKSKMDGTREPGKRAVLLRRFELYADAANHLERRLPLRKD